MTSESFLDGRVTLHSGDCLDVLAALEPESIDAVVTDPPYHFTSIVKRFGGEGAAAAKPGAAAHHTGAYARASRGFMGKEWDGGDIAFRAETWAALARVMKPGAHLVAFAAPKNVHHMAVAIEAGGLEVRDRFLRLFDQDVAIRAFVDTLSDAQADAFWRCVEESGFSGELAWIFGTGFPKSHAVALDLERKLCRAEKRDGRTVWVYASDGAEMRREPPFRAPLANAFAGYGTALKPAYEPIVIARKPLSGTVAETAESHGTGALNIDGCRVGFADAADKAESMGKNRHADFGSGPMKNAVYGRFEKDRGNYCAVGRWPANLVHDGSDAATAGFPDTGKSSGGQVSLGAFRAGAIYGTGRDERERRDPGFGDSGSAARFFYADKADGGDRLGSRHPTVKPLDLMQWLVRLVTPPTGEDGGMPDREATRGADGRSPDRERAKRPVVLDPFAGTGTTGEAAFREGMSAVLIERESEYQADIRRRMALALAGPEERRRATAKAKGEAPAPEGLFAWQEAQSEATGTDKGGQEAAE
ncbi:DNA methyltransferase [Amorphus sp. 3PC139-8]|uniref:DNA methyltransferase n=1 Tax=Amorphus sp. 3PC139-8 TaxID=2735676 RepID=UPI00345C857D